MRNIMIEDTSLLLVICTLVLLLLLSGAQSIRPQMWIYPFVRYGVQVKVDIETRHMAVYETEHFRIKYTQVDADTVGMIAEAAEDAYVPVIHDLRYAPPGKRLMLRLAIWQCMKANTLELNIP